MWAIGDVDATSAVGQTRHNIFARETKRDANPRNDANSPSENAQARTFTTALTTENSNDKVFISTVQKVVPFSHFVLEVGSAKWEQKELCVS
jgi:hypothetical protein